MTNQNNKLDEILDSLYCDAWFAGRVAEREQSGIRSVTPKFDEAKQAIQALYAPKPVENGELRVTGETSDGYHTFNELYDYRRVYNATLFNEWACFFPIKYNVHKSWKHSDGEDCFGGGWFIVMATLPTGQISNHYEAKYWNDFNVPEKPRADEYDGHTPQQALTRLAKLLDKEQA